MKITEHDIDLFRREPELPGLGALLDPNVIGQRIAEGLGIEQIEVRPNYVRFKPGVNCLVGYEFEGDGIPERGYAKAFARDDRAKLLKTVRKSIRVSSEGQTLLLDDLGVVVHFFPYDAQLRSLSHVHGPGLQQRVLTRVFGPDQGLFDASLVPIRYKPERRFVARLETTDGRQFAIKFLAEDDFQHAKLAARQVVRRTGVPGSEIAGVSDKDRILAFDWIKGSILTDHVRSVGHDRDVFESLGQTLALFHKSKVPKLPNRTVASVLAAIEAAIVPTVHVMPELSEEAASIHDRLSRRLRKRWRKRLVPIHGDFYADQVLVSGPDVAILDFDSAVLGQLESDVANLLAHLVYDVVAGRTTSDTVGAVRDDLIAAYRHHGLKVNERRLDLLTATSLLLLLPLPFRTRAENWPEITRRILGYAGDMVWGVSTGSEIVVRPAGLFAGSERETDGLDPVEMLRTATDVVKVDPLMKRVIWGAMPDSGKRLVVSARIVKHRLGMRCLIAYELSDGQVILGKSRFVAPDRRTLTLQRALWDGEFGPTSSDGVRVPEPVGEIPELNMWLQRHILAPDGWKALHKEGGTLSADRIAQTLIKLQRSGPDTPRRHSLEDELRKLGDQLAPVCERYPKLAPEIQRLEKECREIAALIPPFKPVPAHRDFHPDNVLLSESSTWLLDLDLYCLSHPLLDAGNYLGHLWEAAIRGKLPAKVVGTFEKRLTRVLSRKMERDVRLEIEVFAILTLARHVAISRRVPVRRRFTRKTLESVLRRSSDLIHRVSVTE